MKPTLTSRERAVLRYAVAQFNQQQEQRGLIDGEWLEECNGAFRKLGIQRIKNPNNPNKKEMPT